VEGRLRNSGWQALGGGLTGGGKPGKGSLALTAGRHPPLEGAGGFI